MTLKTIKYSFALLLTFSFLGQANTQCDSETISSTLSINMDNCQANNISGTNTDYSEFTATVSNNDVCNNLSLSGGNLYRVNPIQNPHSCAPGVDGTIAMCVGYANQNLGSCDYIPGSDKAVRFDLVVDPKGGETVVNGFNFYELSGPTFTFQDGISGANNHATYFAVRVLANGVEVFHEIDVPTSTVWSLESFDFSNYPAFTVSSTTTFSFELTAYCANFIGSDYFIWDLDEINVNTTCQTIPVDDLDSSITIAGGQTDSSCNGTSFTFISGQNQQGATCTWFFNWPSTDPSTIFIGPNPTYTYPVEGIYTIRKEVTLGNCFEASELQVSAFNSGIIGNGIGGSVDGIDVDLTSCNGNTVQLNLTSNATDSNVGYEVNSWNWTIVINGVAQAATGPSVPLVVNSTDVISLTLLVGSTSGCEATFVENFNVSEILPGMASFVASFVGCTDTGYLISIADNTNTGGNEVSSYSWTATVDGQTIDPGNVPSFTIESDSDVFSILHNVAYTNGCPSQEINQSISITDSFLPTFDINIVGSNGGGGGNGDCGSDLDPILEVIISGGSVNGTVTSVDWTVTVGADVYTFTGNPVDIGLIVTDTAVVVTTINYSNGCIFTASETFTPGDFGGGGMDPNIEVTFNGNPVIDCENDDTPLLINPNPNYSYNWDPTTGLTFTDNVNFSDPIVSVTEITLYNLTITDGPCTLDTSVLVIPEFLATPTIGVNGVGADGNIFCNGMVSLTITNPIAGVTYEWSCGSDFTDIVGTGTELMYDAGAFGEKEFCARIAGANSACDIFACVTAIDGGPSLSYDNPFQICPGDTVALSIINNYPDQIITYEFEDNPNIVGFDDEGFPILVLDENGAGYEISFVATTDNGCILEDTIAVEADESEQLSFVPSVPVCGELTICFDPSGLNSNTGIPAWDFGDESTTDDVSSEFNPCYTYPALGSYEVTLMDLSDICPGIAVTMTVDVTEVPTISIASDTLEFSSNMATVMAETTGNPEDITWCDADGMNIGSGPVLDYEFETPETVLAKIVDQYGCGDTTSVVLIFTEIIDPFDDLSDIMGPDEGVCADEIFTLSVDSDDPSAYTYNWGPADCVVSNGDQPEVTVQVSNVDKEFMVTVTNAEGLDTVLNYLVTVNLVNFTLDCDFENGEINFGSSGTISVVDAPVGSTYSWSTGDTDSSITVTPEENTTYSVTVTDENGCTEVASKEVTVRMVECSENGVFLPTAFSPNGDGVNDILKLRSLWLENIDVFIIYDRWGEEIYNANGDMSGWDGTFNNEQLAPDVFAFCVKGTCIDGTEFTRVGNVSLIR